MHYYEYHLKSTTILSQASKKYAWLFSWWLSHESIEVRYYLLEYLCREYWYRWILEKDEKGKPIPITLQSSVLLWLKVPKLLLWLNHFSIYFRFIFGNLKNSPVLKNYGVKQFQISPKISSIDTKNSSNKEAKDTLKIKKKEIKQWIQLYWSISHSENYVAFIVSDAPTGIDIVEYRERDPSLLDIHRDSEYEILGEKSWINFSIFWTAKESIIKLLWWHLDDIANIACIEKQTNNISLFAFQHEKYRIQTFMQDSIIISYII